MEVINQKLTAADLQNVAGWTKKTEVKTDSIIEHLDITGKQCVWNMETITIKEHCLLELIYTSIAHLQKRKNVKCPTMKDLRAQFARFVNPDDGITTWHIDCWLHSPDNKLADWISFYGIASDNKLFYKRKARKSCRVPICFQLKHNHYYGIFNSEYVQSIRQTALDQVPAAYRRVFEKVSIIPQLTPNNFKHFTHKAWCRNRAKFITHGCADREDPTESARVRR